MTGIRSFLNRKNPSIGIVVSIYSNTMREVYIYICFFCVKNRIWHVFPLRIIYCNDQLLNLECINYYRLNLINQIHIRNAILSMLFLLLNVNRKVINDIYKLDIINLCVKSVNIKDIYVWFLYLLLVYLKVR